MNLLPLSSLSSPVPLRTFVSDLLTNPSTSHGGNAVIATESPGDFVQKVQELTAAAKAPALFAKVALDGKGRAARAVLRANGRTTGRYPDTKALSVIKAAQHRLIVLFAAENLWHGLKGKRLAAERAALRALANAANEERCRVVLIGSNAVLRPLVMDEQLRWRFHLYAAPPPGPDWLQQLEAELAATPPAPIPAKQGLTDEHVTRALEALAEIAAADEEADVDDQLDYLHAFSHDWSTVDVAKKTAFPPGARQSLIAFMSTYRIEQAQRDLLVVKHNLTTAERILDASRRFPPGEERGGKG